MKYIIMCGGEYKSWSYPRQLTTLFGEAIIDRTIGLLKDPDVGNIDKHDIAISSNNTRFDCRGVARIEHRNNYDGHNGLWMEAFPPMDEPACFLFGDVVFSPDAIKRIVSYENPPDNLPAMFFGSAPPFSKYYFKSGAEPFAFKVWDQKRFRQAIADTYTFYKAGKYLRAPIAWELWHTIRGTDPLKGYNNYEVINDYTCDIDYESDIEPIKDAIVKSIVDELPPIT